MNIKGLALCLSSALLIPSLQAKPIDFTPGLSGGISLNAGINQTNSQFNTNDDNAITQDLNRQGKQTETAAPFILGRLQYTFGNQAIFVGNSEDQISEAQFQAEVGYIQMLAKGTYLTAALFGNMPGMDETWQDPYLTNQERQTTEQNIMGGRLAFSTQIPFPLTLKYAFAQSEIDDDTIGISQSLSSAQQKSLRRDSTYQRVGVELSFPLSQTFILSPAFYYTDKNADGSAQSSAEIASQLSVVAIQNRHELIATVRNSEAEYDAENPVFNLRQDYKAFSVFAVYNYHNPFALQNTQLNVMAGYQQHESDIDFYDSENTFISTGISYTF